MEFDDPTKAVLKPRNEGESLKIAETVLRRRDRNIEAKGERARKIAKAKKIRHKVKTYRITPPDKLLKLSRKRQVDKRRLCRVTRLKKSKVKKNSKVILVQRNRRKGGSKQTKEMLYLLRLGEPNTCVFLPNDLKTLEQLKVIRPFVVWGSPSFELVDDLLHKRAWIVNDKKRPILLSDNSLIEEHLGENGMFCVEDVVNEIFSCGENFTEVALRLRPFQLGDFTDKQAHGFLRERGIPWGDVKSAINERIRRFIGSKDDVDTKDRKKIV